MYIYIYIYIIFSLSLSIYIYIFLSLSLHIYIYISIKGHSPPAAPGLAIRWPASRAPGGPVRGRRRRPGEPYNF